MKNRSILLTVGLWVACEVPPAPEPLVPTSAQPASEAPLSAQEAFDSVLADAACTCEELIMLGEQSYGERELCAGDQVCVDEKFQNRALKRFLLECAEEHELLKYAEDWTAADGQRIQCTQVRARTGPRFYADENNPFASPQANGCIYAFSSGVGSFGGAEGIATGACAGDFHYCLAQQLTSRAHSFIAAPEDRETYEIILRQARQRYQKAALNYTTALGHVAVGCPDLLEPDRCKAFDEGFGPTAISRMMDATAQVGELLEEEIESRIRAAHAIDRRAGPEALWGNNGPLAEAARLAMGDPGDGLPSDDDATGPRWGALPFAAQWTSDKRVHRALELLQQQKVPTVGACNPPHVGGNGRWVEPVISQRVIQPEQAWRFLNDRLWRNVATRRITPPGGGAEVLVPLQAPDSTMTRAEYDALQAAETPPDDLVQLGVEPLYPPGRAPAESYGVTKEDVRHAIELLLDLLTVHDVEYTLTEVVDEARFENGFVLPSCNLSRVDLADGTFRQRDPLYLATALSSDIETLWGAASATGYACQNDLGCNPWNPDAVSCWAEVTEPSILDPVPGRIDGAGASWSMSQLRQSLLKLKQIIPASEPTSLPSGNHLQFLWQNRSAVDLALGVVDGYVGTRWTETQRMSPGGPDLVWRLYDRPTIDKTDLGQGHPIFLRDWKEASCLTHGSRPVGQYAHPVVNPGPNHCRSTEYPSSLIPTPDKLLPESYAWATGSYPICPLKKGYETTRCYQLGPNGSVPVPQTLYVVWARECEEGAAGCAHKYELIDIIRNSSRIGSVSAYGGEFGQRFAELMAKSFDNPAAPLATIYNVDYDFVPPIEHELIDDGDQTESSWRVYLERAEDAALAAQVALAKARDYEIQTVKANEINDEQRTSAALAEEVEAVALCGSAGANAKCEVERRDVSIYELGLLNKVVPEYWLGDWETPYGDDSLFWTRALVVPRPSGVKASFAVVLGPVESMTTYDKTCTDFAATFYEDYAPPVPRCEFGEAIADVLTPRKKDRCDFEQSITTYIRDFLGAVSYCTHYSVVDALMRLKLRQIPVPVIEAIQGKASSSFAEYGGEQRAVLVKAYNDLENLQRSVGDLSTVFAGLTVYLDQAAIEAGRAASSSWENLSCNMKETFKSFAQIGKGIARIIGQDYMGGNDINSGLWRLHKMTKACGAGNQDAMQKAMEALRVMILEMDKVTRLEDDAARLLGELFKADENLDALTRRADAARMKRDVANRVSGAENQASLPQWIALRGLEAKRARKAVRKAEELAFIARRAIEFRLGTDLRDLTKPEVYVDAPASWVNDIFVANTATAKGENANARVNVSGEAVLDYVRKLRDLMEGYSFERRYAEGRDTAVISVNQLSGNLYFDTVPLDETSQPPFEYGLAHLNHEETLADVNIALTGTPSASHTPTGFSGPLSTINDGIRLWGYRGGWPGEDVWSQQYDTYDGQRHEREWYAISFGSSHEFKRVIFQEGVQHEGGGFFETINVEVLQGSTWVPVRSLSVSPAYLHRVDMENQFTVYTFDFEPISGTAIRIIGDTGLANTWETYNYTSVAEFEVYEAVKRTTTPLNARLWFKCKNYPTLLAGGRTASQLRDVDPTSRPCEGEVNGVQLGGVDYARADFGLDDSLAMFMGEDLSAGTFNFRTRRIAANMVGTDLIDCTGLSQDCRNDLSVNYTIRQSGEVTLENYEGALSTWAMEPGVINHARALASERVITSPISRADQAQLGSFYRSEWWGRPLPGFYSVYLYDRVGFDWRELEDVQILLEYDYWTRQL